MGWLNIRTYPDPILMEKAKEICDIDHNLDKLVKDMIETMYSAPGIGLAAPQVGIGTRLVIIDRSLGKGRSPLVMLNPKIISADGTVFAEEGCLSLPDSYGHVKRAKVVEIEFIDLQGKQRRLVGEDMLARVFQHEIDHLEGILFLDRMDHFHRNLLRIRYLKRMKKKKR